MNLSPFHDIVTITLSKNPCVHLYIGMLEDNLMLLTTGNHFENHTIESYCGIVSGECVLGTGFLSSLDATIADFLGISSTSYNEKLDAAKQAALSIVEKKAAALGANAIISVDIDYTTFTADLIGVVVNGTAVKITPVGSRKEILLQSHSDCSLTPTKLIIQSNISAPLAKLEVSFSRLSSSIDYILADIHLRTFSDESLDLENIVFSSFSNSGSIFSSSYTILPISFAQSASVQSALISIKKCSIDSSLIFNSDPTFSHPSNVPNILSSHSIDLLSSAEQLGSASEILSFLETLKKNDPANVNDNLILQITNLAKTERLYGNMKDGCLKKIKEYT